MRAVDEKLTINELGPNRASMHDHLLNGCGVSISTTCVLWDMVHILHVADEMRFGEPLPSGWEHSSSVY